mmetsp:Transcript_10996/g.25117  ORF Transcript_10996/g.25117 Transcript_10996/m.25117 type:complete len:773 (+) Transcript_10996:196-2514(+)
MRRWGRKLAPASQNATTIDIDSDVASLSAHGDAARSRPDLQGAVGELPSSAASTGSCTLGQGSSAVSAVLEASRRDVPINPRLSVAFAGRALAGSRSFYDPPASGAWSSTAAGGSSSASRAGKCPPSTLLWVRPFDLRIHDNPALNYAAQQRRPVYAVFAWSTEEDAEQGPWKLAGTAYAFWMHHALLSLEADLLQRYGLRLLYRSGSSTGAVLAQVAQECTAAEVVTSKAYDPAGEVADRSAAAALQAVGVKLQRFQSFLLYNIEDIRVDMSSWRGHFGTLTPFHSACSACGQPPKPVQAPNHLTAGSLNIGSVALSSLGFARMPVRKDGTVVDWGSPILDAWSISEDAALSTLRQFLQRGGGFSRYEKERHLADASGVARISPYLRAGMLSCRLMYWEIMDAGGRHTSVTFWRRLTWRDLAYWQLHHFPQMRDKPIRAHYEGQSWRNTADGALDLWRKGRTGYPLIDAGMKELWVTGWMAQNARMAAAVLLCELLNINWVEGELWFHHTLVDADPAINAMMWQNAGKGGLDQWNFTLHPARSGKTQDPSGKYLRRWLPQLAQLPSRYLHSPWEASPDVLRKAGVIIGTGGNANYPERIIKDVSGASRASSTAIRQQRARNLTWNDAGGYDLILIPRGSTKGNDGQKFRIFTKKDWRLPGGGQHEDRSSWHEDGEYGQEDGWDGEDWDQSGWSWEASYQNSGWQQGPVSASHRHQQGGRGASVAQQPARQRRRVERPTTTPGNKSSSRAAEAGAGSFQTVLDEYMSKASGA